MGVWLVCQLGVDCWGLRFGDWSEGLRIDSWCGLGGRCTGLLSRGCLPCLDLAFFSSSILAPVQCIL